MLAPSPTTTRAMRVVVVDDSPVARTVIRQGLEVDHTIEVVGLAGDAPAGLEMIARMLPDAVVMDLVLPGMDGLTAIKEVRRRWPHLATVLFTGAPESAETLNPRAQASGVHGVVRKPAALPSLDHAVRYVHDELAAKLLGLCRAATPARPSAGAGPILKVEETAATGRFAAVVIGASTGGPDAVENVLRAFLSHPTDSSHPPAPASRHARPHPSPRNRQH